MAGPAWALASGYDRVVTTCHGPFSGELRAIYRRYGKRLPVVAISHDQAAHAPEIAVDRVIHHGLDPDEYPVGGGDGGYLLRARLNVSLPGLDREVAQALVDAAHQICPYSKATRGNIDVDLSAQV